MPIHIDLSKSNLENTSDKDKKVEVPAVLASEKDRSVFQKLSAGAKEFYLNLQEKVEKSALNIKTIDKAQLMWNSRLLERHERKSAELSTQISSAEKDAAFLEKAAGNRASFLEEFKKKHPNYSGDLSKLEKEAVEVKQDFQKRIEKINQTKDKLETKLQYRNDKKAVYENKRKTIVEGVSEKIGERLSPHEKRMEKLQGRKEKLETEINDFAALKDNFHQEVEELEADLGQANFRVEKKMLKEAISLIRKELREAEKNIETRRRQKITIETRLAKINKKANKWRDLRNAFIRVSQRQVEFQAVHKKDEIIAGRRKEVEPMPEDRRVIRDEVAKEIFEANEDNEAEEADEDLSQFSEKEEGEQEIKTEKMEAAIPFVITQDIRQQLADLGWGREEQRNIDPLRAQEIIKNQETYKKTEASQPSEAGSAEGSPEIKEQVGAKSSLSSYLEAWNALAGRNYRINPEQFIKSLNIPQDLVQQEIALETLEGFVRGYYSRLKEGGEKNIFEGSGLKRQLKGTARRLGLKE
jgi:myosin heavy subunit